MIKYYLNKCMAMLKLFRLSLKIGLNTSPAKLIYDFMIQEVFVRNGSLIPTRSEKKSVNVKWSISWKNFKLLNGLTADEKCFQ